MKKITSVEHAQDILGTQIQFDKIPEALIAIGMHVKYIEPLVATHKLWLITEANNKLNNWDNKKYDPNQIKYSVWAPDIKPNPLRPAGFGLVFGGVRDWCTYTSVGARVEVGSRDEAKYIFEDFIELWDTAWLFQNE